MSLRLRIVLSALLALVLLAACPPPTNDGIGTSPSEPQRAP
jgi:hypothetical protein